uniref:Uncharacterized protein n=1 Tax=Fagus sylvatica TaxID=28930 RepID=A0A2N9I279_FAGSY
MNKAHCWTGLKGCPLRCNLTKPSWAGAFHHQVEVGLENHSLDLLQLQLQLHLQHHHLTLVKHVQKGRRGSGFHKALKKLLKPILGRMGSVKNSKKEVPDPRNPKSWKAFSRSLRV